MIEESMEERVSFLEFQVSEEMELGLEQVFWMVEELEEDPFCLPKMRQYCLV